MDPWGTPEVTGSGCDVAPFVNHLLRPVGKVVRNPVVDLHWDIQQCLMRHTVKGFAPIKENARNRLALFQIGCQSRVASKRGVIVDCPKWKPNLLLVRVELHSCYMFNKNSVHMMLQGWLMVGRSDIGWYNLTSWVLDSIGMGKYLPASKQQETFLFSRTGYIGKQ